MYKFDDNSIVLNTIKGLLHTFNLPTIRVITPTTQLFKDCLYVYNNLTKIESNLIELKTELTTKLYTKESIKVEDAKQEELNQKGNIASLKTRNNS